MRTPHARPVSWDSLADWCAPGLITAMCFLVLSNLVSARLLLLVVVIVTMLFTLRTETLGWEFMLRVLVTPSIALAFYGMAQSLVAPAPIWGGICRALACLWLGSIGTPIGRLILEEIGRRLRIPNPYSIILRMKRKRRPRRPTSEVEPVPGANDPVVAT